MVPRLAAGDGTTGSAARGRGGESGCAGSGSGSAGSGATSERGAGASAPLNDLSLGLTIDN